MRYWSVIPAMCATAIAFAAGPLDAEAEAQWDLEGQRLFQACEFKQAARAFEKALTVQAGNAALHYWRGKSYARLAEVSSLLSAPSYARKARRSLERAVEIAPRNVEFLLELLEFDVDSPEWFGGGLQRAAALLERFKPGDPVAGALRDQLADSRKEHSGPGWRMQWAALRAGGAIGHFVPEP